MEENSITAKEVVVDTLPPPSENQVMRTLPLSTGMQWVNSFATFTRDWVGWSVFRVDERSVVALASKAPQSELFGDQSNYLRGLQLLCNGLRKQPLTQTGVLFFRTFIERLITVRSAVMDYVVKSPEIAKIEIKQPIIVLGLPRTGSTLLYNLIACDPKSRSPQFWEMYQAMDPVPPTTKETFKTDPRIEILRKRLEDVDRLMPGFFAEISKSHPIKADQPDEELFALFHQLILSLHMVVGGQEFENWSFEEFNKDYAYVYLKRFLQMLHSGYAPEDHWTLKSPFHALYPKALMDTFPDARVVVTHRELSSVLPSLARLMETQVQYLYEDQTLDRRILGRQVLRMTDLMTKRLHTFRTNHPNKDQFFDVRYDQITDDPIALVKSIYTHFGMTVTSQHEERMRTFLVENPQGRHGRNTYEPEDFGLDKRQINAHFADYIKTYLY